jgi:glycosyltransferase involved in cell wall biosynthesis
VRLGQNARQQASEKYSWKAYTRRLEEIYLTVLENDSSAFPATEIY